MRFRSLDFMVVGYCACLPRSIFGSQLGIILFHSYLQLIHPQISPDYWAEYGRMLFTAGLCKPWPVEHQRPIAISLPIQPCLTARLEHHEAKRMNPRRRLMLPDQKLQQKKNKPKVALANGRKRKLFLPPPTSKYICIIWATRSMRQLKTAEESLCQNWWLDIPVYQWSFHTALLSRIEASFVCTWRKEPKKLSRSETKAAMPHGVRTNELCVHQHSFYCKMPEKKHDLFMSLHLLSLSHLPS